MRAVARRFLRERCRQPELRAADLATAQLDPLAEIEKQAKSGDVSYTRFLERLEQMSAASASVGAALTRRVSRPHPAEAYRVGAATGRPPEANPTVCPASVGAALTRRVSRPAFGTNAICRRQIRHGCGRRCVWIVCGSKGCLLPFESNIMFTWMKLRTVPDFMFQAGLMPDP